MDQCRSGSTSPTVAGRDDRHLGNGHPGYPKQPVLKWIDPCEEGFIIQLEYPFITGCFEVPGC